MYTPKVLFISRKGTHKALEKTVATIKGTMTQSGLATIIDDLVRPVMKQGFSVQLEGLLTDTQRRDLARRLRSGITWVADCKAHGSTLWITCDFGHLKGDRLTREFDNARSQLVTLVADAIYSTR